MSYEYTIRENRRCEKKWRTLIFDQHLLRVRRKRPHPLFFYDSCEKCLTGCFGTDFDESDEIIIETNILGIVLYEEEEL